MKTTLASRMNFGFRAPKVAPRSFAAVPLTPEQGVIAHMAASILLDYPTPARRAQFALVEASVSELPGELHGSLADSRFQSHPPTVPQRATIASSHDDHPPP